ncbi:MAG TPA: hypothetical protein VMU01_03770 [Rhizomicrobium sp.]|nr:hypothetical protein [Rhizomicrobium sp.]
MRTRALVTGLVSAVALAANAAASTDTLSDAELVARVNAVFSVKETTADRILGVHRGLPVIVDVRCGDVCPNYTVRIIHYGLDAGAVCTRMGGDNASIAVPAGIAVTMQPFCIPHVLFQRKLYVDHPYQAK